MAVIPTTSNTHNHDHHHRRRRKKEKKTPTKPVASATSSWEHFKSLLSCRSIAPSQAHDPSASQAHDPSAGVCGRNAKVGPTICGGSICALRNVVHGNTRVVHHNHNSPQASAASCGPHETRTPLVGHHPPPRGGMQLRKLSGCYECHAISVEPLSRYPRPRTLCACSDCGEVFTKPDSLELHRNLRHAVSELGPEDSGRNIVEIIFKSSWQKQDRPICTIERILKVHNTQRTISRFEDYRDSVKAKSAASVAANAKSQQHPKKDPRCAADGNELLRFHCAALSCPLGARGSAALCISSAAAAEPCGVCSVIRHGFSRGPQCPRGVGTTASSGRAHDLGPASPESRRAMLVCRVIAGRIRRSSDDHPAADVSGGGGWFDSVGTGANLEELFVSNPRAILPCFVVIYRTLD